MVIEFLESALQLNVTSLQEDTEAEKPVCFNKCNPKNVSYLGRL